MAETTSRILSLLNLLQTHRQWPGGELAQRLGVTARTLRRDIERLRELGYRVEATRGVTGGYRLEAGTQMPPLLLTGDEAVTMAIGLRVAAATGLVDGEQTTLSALAKFEQVLPAELRQRVSALSASVQPLTAGRRGAPVSHDLLGVLALACRDRARIRFHYVAGDGAETDRLVEPHTLVSAARSWFFLCWDLQRDDWRTFRVDRMSAFFGTRVHFEPRELPAKDAAAYVAQAMAGLGRRHSAEVRLSIPLAELQRRLGPYANGARAIDARTSGWPLHGDSYESMLASIAWIPADLDYELRGSPEFLAFVRAAAERMLGAGAADSLVPSGAD
ncbi:WYL domain-containing protein [Herbiconiux sp. 11R-BC]|uniref:helix-turn-helix transcriptional regulator n=1 Tax=Herbiconiux sp. 11R-BC TaxID=3111637 RepID=UPI003C070831